MKSRPVGAFLSAEVGVPIQGFEVFVTIPKQHGLEIREWTYVRKDGTHLTVNLCVTAVRNEQEKLPAILASQRTSRSARKRSPRSNGRPLKCAPSSSTSRVESH